MKELSGECSLTVGETTYPIKFGIHALREFCQDMSVPFYGFSTLFHVSRDEQDEPMAIPVDPLLFYPALLKAGINWPRLKAGEPLLTLSEAEELLDQIGGIYAKGLLDILFVFMAATSPYLNPRGVEGPKKNEEPPADGPTGP